MLPLPEPWPSPGLCLLLMCTSGAPAQTAGKDSAPSLSFPICTKKGGKYLTVSFGSLDEITDAQYLAQSGCPPNGRSLL